MVHEIILDKENEKELSIHFNNAGELVITIENSDNDDTTFQFIHLTKEDCDWIVKKINYLQSTTF